MCDLIELSASRDIFSGPSSWVSEGAWGYLWDWFFRSLSLQLHRPLWPMMSPFSIAQVTPPHMWRFRTT